jgi:hypothetical protein
MQTGSERANEIEMAMRHVEAELRRKSNNTARHNEYRFGCAVGADLIASALDRLAQEQAARQGRGMVAAMADVKVEDPK